MFITVINALGLGVGLSMDACAVSMANGLHEKEMKKSKELQIAIFFGLFQAIMPLIAYVAITLFDSILGERFATIFEYCIPWLALIILSFLGTKMILEAVKKDDAEKIGELKDLSTAIIFAQAIATSIDAFSVGLIFANKTALHAYVSFAIIGIITFVLSLIAIKIGKKFGTIFSNKAIIIGGIILIIIGIEIFFSNFSSVVGLFKLIFKF